jgi:ATP-dependent RNA helicase HelY
MGALLSFFPRHRNPKRKDYHATRDSSPTIDPALDRPIRLKIHRYVRSALDRIQVPEPKPFVPDPFQTEALEVLEKTDVLVTAPTGAGKTYVALKAIEGVFEKGGRSWYASPLKALSNAKYGEFGDHFGAENVGILTGDRKENVQAPIIVGTTEILRNQLYDTMHQGQDLAVQLVVLDEAHYLGDQDRGVVWEEVLIYLPSRVRLLLLSATIQNAQSICDWLEWMRKSPCRWVSSDDRPVPLYPLFIFPSGDLTPLSTRRGMFSKIRSVDPRSFPKHEFPNVRRLLDVLRESNLLPAIFFLKSRSDCERAIEMCRPPVNQDEEKVAGFQARVEELLNQYPFLRQHQHLTNLRLNRVGAHHGGQLPHWKLFLEKLMQEGLLEAIFSTSTVAAGVNFPARTVVVPQSDRFNGKGFVDLTATDLLQMTGRAGRRGMDEIGFVLVLPGPHQNPQLVHDLLRSTPDPIVSQIRINFSMVLNLLLSHSPDEIRDLFSDSLATHQNLSQELEITRHFRDLQQELDPWIPEMACGSMERLGEVRPQYAILREQLRKARKFEKRQRSMHIFQGLLLPGRIFRSNRGTPYIAIAVPDMDLRTVESVRLGFPLRFRKGRIRSFRVGFHRIRTFCQNLEALPPLEEREPWRELAMRLAASRHSGVTEGDENFEDLGRPIEIEALKSKDQSGDEMQRIASQIKALPCERCTLYGPCQKSTAHPFTGLLQTYFEQHSRMKTIREQLWRDFLKHYHFLQAEGYIDQEGHLTQDGLWASKLRLDQPILISECIRKGIFPEDDPEALAALIAPFVMDRDRPGDQQQSSMVWRYQDAASPYFKMLQSVKPLRENLQNEGFGTPPLPFWTVVTLYYWAKGTEWEEVRQITGMDEGDLAMVILRTADHLRQIESLADTHPQLAATAREAIDRILREPVLI